jgi:hypothetical protein
LFELDRKPISSLTPQQILYWFICTHFRVEFTSLFPPFSKTNEYMKLPYEPIIIRRRFSDFLKLHQDLKEREGRGIGGIDRSGHGGGGDADDFMRPSKKLLGNAFSPFRNFKNRLDDDFIEERKSKLQVTFSCA